MMRADLDSVLGDSISRRLLRLVASERLPLRVLADRVADSETVEPDLARTKMRLDRLQAAGLVGTATAPIDAWTIYFVTAKGLEIARQLNQLR
jgi:hypothetical protein